MTQHLLHTKDLGYAVKNTFLIQNICAEFPCGYLHGILGPNGSGKSTLLKSLAGIWQPTHGTVLWNQTPLMKEQRKTISQTIAFVPQNPQVHFNFLVEEMVAMGRYAHLSHYWKGLKDDVLQEALHAVDAWHLRSRRIMCLSQGEKQRVYIARALASQAPILLLDEPTANLDIRHQLDIWQLMRSLTEKNKIVIAATHDIALAKRYCHTLAILHQGHCIKQGPAASIMTTDILQDVFQVSSSSYDLDFKSCN